MPNRIFINTARSICPECGRLVDAKIYSENDKVYMEKYCLNHLDKKKNRILISSSYEYYRNSHQYIKPGQIQEKYFSEKIKGCPNDCGLCEEHEQHICMPVFEITGTCNLNCPICISKEDNRDTVSLDQIKLMTEKLLESEGKIDLVNLSGGEPLLHPEYRQIIEYLSSLNDITKISVSTNGLLLLENDDLLQFHKDHSVIVSLQLDGCQPGIYEKLRGRDLIPHKNKIVKKLIKHDITWSIIMTIAKGINDDIKNVKYVYDLFLENENCLSLMFHPLVYRKGIPDKFNSEQRLTIPDVIRLISDSSIGEITDDDFIPLPCCNANCFSLVHLLETDDKKYLPVKRFLQQDKYIDIIKNKSLFGTDRNSFEEIRDIIFSIWSDTGDMCTCMKTDTEKALKSMKSIIKGIYQKNSSGEFNAKKAFDTASRKIKSIYIHHFMDNDTFDLTRARRCCTIYPKPDGKFYPICVYNNLYRGKK